MVGHFGVENAPKVEDELAEGTVQDLDCAPVAADLDAVLDQESAVFQGFDLQKSVDRLASSDNPFVLPEKIVCLLSFSLDQ